MIKDNFWTDELVAEFTTWSLTQAPTMQGRYADIEQFKEMKSKEEQPITKERIVVQSVLCSDQFNKDGIRCYTLSLNRELIYGEGDKIAKAIERSINGDIEGDGKEDMLGVAICCLKEFHNTPLQFYSPDKKYTHKDLEEAFSAGRGRIGGFWNEQIKNWKYPTLSDYRHHLPVINPPTDKGTVKDKEQDWEILKMKDNRDGTIHPPHPVSCALANPPCSIHSVKRISDNSIFVIEGNIHSDKVPVNIESFELRNNRMTINLKQGGFIFLEQANMTRNGEVYPKIPPTQSPIYSKEEYPPVQFTKYSRLHDFMCNFYSKYPTRKDLDEVVAIVKTDFPEPPKTNY